MSQFFDITKVIVGAKTFTAHVTCSGEALQMTSAFPEATADLVELLPGLAQHACYGDSDPSFGEVVADTELVHLLEHVTVELLAQTNASEQSACAQTRALDEEHYELTFDCVDDVLVAAALSSAVWLMQWAYTSDRSSKPDVAAVVDGLVQLVVSLQEAPEVPVVSADETTQLDTPQLVSEPASEQPELSAETSVSDEVPSEETVEELSEVFESGEDAEVTEEEPAPTTTWDLEAGPKPHSVR